MSISQGWFQLEKDFASQKGWWYYPHPAVCVLSLVMQLVLVTVQLHKMDQLAVWLKTSNFFSFSECKQAVLFYFRVTQLLIPTKGRMQEYAVGH